MNDGSELFGMRVWVRWSEECPWYKEQPERVFRNVTEIHWRYPGAPTHTRVAFESNIHGTGMTYIVEWIAEFEAKEETQVAEAF